MLAPNFWEAILSTALSVEAKRVLRAVGWSQDRYQMDVARRLIKDVSKKVSSGSRQFRTFPLLFEVLARYGGLEVSDTITDMIEFHLIPARGMMSRSGYTYLEDLARVEVFPLGFVPEEFGNLALGADGRVFMIHSTGELIVGSDINEALNNLVSGAGLSRLY